MKRPDEVGDVAGFRQGDSAVFARLVETHSPRLISYLAGYADGAIEAEDLAQETWVRAYRSRSSFRGDGSVLAWLFSIARSVGLDAVKRAKAPTVETPAVVDSPAIPDEVLQRQETAASVRRAILELPDRQRTTVVLRLIEGRSTRETAEAMNCATGTVKAALSQALDNLRKHSDINLSQEVQGDSGNDKR